MSNNFKIGNHIVSNNSKPFVIAEAGSNFNQSLETAYKLIDVAAEANADAVKFQLFSAETLYPKGTKEYESVKAVELNPDWVGLLNKHAIERNILFMASAFDHNAVDTLEDVGVCAHKIASSEATNLSLISYIASKKRPIIISTGMCDIVDITEAIRTSREGGNQNVALLQCYAMYPLPSECANLKVIDLLQKLYEVPTGFSDHTLGINTALAAVARGASIIEKHFTLDRNSEGPDHFYALEPSELNQFVSSIHDVYTSIGKTCKELLPEERQYGRREGIYAAKNIKKGEKFTSDNLCIKRPALGLRSRYIGAIQGACAKVNIATDNPISWDHIEF